MTKSLFPAVSIVIVSFNTRELTLDCVRSIMNRTVTPGLEVIVVDNASDDGSSAALSELSARHPNLTVHRNDVNVGFAAAVNIGLRSARGDVLVIMNSDVIVPDNWMRGMLRALEDPNVGLVGPVTNSIGNEAKIRVDYSDLDEMNTFAQRWMKAHVGHQFEIEVLAMYCLAMRRESFESIGLLDEEFGIGWFEDDDYSHRARQKGLRVVCTEESFVHHFGQASFEQLIREGKHTALWNKNLAYYEGKWGKWRPHQLRSQ